MNDSPILFNVSTPLGFQIRTTLSRWELIITDKHPVMRGRLDDVQQTLIDPDEIRRSKTDFNIYLFYRTDGVKRWICVVARGLNGEGFLITAYRTSAIKEGEPIWHK